MPHRRVLSKQGREITGRPGIAANDACVAPKVLIVDDDPGVRLLMHETLGKAGFEVSDAASGAEAIECCSEFEPDLVLLDINMPVMDGITACTEIRKHSEREFPIVMVTSVDDSESIQRAFDAGATDFILKPINWPLFQRRLDSVLTEWNRAQEFDASNKRVQLLEMVAPEQVMVVSRSGAVIQDLKNRGAAAGGATPPATLESLYDAAIARRMQQRISGVLKTGRHNSLEFTVAEHGIERNFEAQFLVEGRDRVIIVVQDVSGGEQARGEIYDLAYVDSATRLPNRHLFERHAEDKLTSARLQGRGAVFFSLCFDNISEQHLADQDMMRAVADRLRNCLANFRQVPPIGKGESAGRVARVETNRFMFMLENDQYGDQRSAICERISRELTGQIEAEAGTVTISPRLGIAMYPADGQDLQTIMHVAGAAMNEALETGKLFCFQSRAAAEPSPEVYDYGNELRQALETNQLELYFQPRRSLPDGTVTCLEALLRWNHPIRGFVDLTELLYLAKASGLIVALGDWVLQHACEAAGGWRHDPLPRVSVNLSQQEFTRQDLAERVIEALEMADLEPSRIELELTEAALLRTSDGLAELERLKELGVGLVLDNFGTGHSSLAHLKNYPIDALKIDGSFVRGLPGNDKDVAVCEVIVTMAQLFGMKAVAEGVENEQQLQLLQKLGCDEFQGYYICHPLPANRVDSYLRKPGNLEN